MSGEGLREMTVAEMNELRAKAGLAPLVEDDTPKTTNQRTVMQNEYEANKSKVKEKKDLKGGIRIHHNFDDIEEDTETILVLEDKNILEDDDSDEDVLVNLNLLEKEKSRRNQELKKKRTIYDEYDEHDRSGSILSKYDEKEKGPKGFVVSVDKTVSFKTPEDSTTMRHENSNGAILMSNPNYEKKIASDYYTPDEAKIVFNKKRDKKKVVKKKKSMKKRALTLLKDLEAEEHELISREDFENVQKKEDVKEQEENRARFKRYKMAEQSASERSKLVFDDEKEESRYAKNLERSRRKIIEQRNPEDIAKRVAEARQKEEENNKEDDGIVFSSVHEFLSVIPTGGGEDEAEEDDIHQMLTFKQSVPEEVMEVNEENEKEKSKDVEIESMELETETPRLKVPTEETLENNAPKKFSSKGLGSTLEFLKRTQPLFDQKIVVGRATDKKEIIMGNPDNKEPRDNDLPRINLDEYDEHGNVLSTKERFRKFSQAFHGKKSGKNKLEKRSKRIKEMEKAKRQTIDDALKRLENVHKAQEEKKTPYIAMSGYKHLKK